MSDDIKRAREYGDEFRKYLFAALTGGIGITLSIAGLLTGEGVAPEWSTMPIGIFSIGLIVVGLGLLMGEHRSLLRNKDSCAQKKMPWYKMGITWNIFALLWLIVGIGAAVYGLNGVVLPADECQPNPTEVTTDAN
jgi:hypothetical protein